MHVEARLRLEAFVVQTNVTLELFQPLVDGLHVNPQTVKAAQGFVTDLALCKASFLMYPSNMTLQDGLETKGQPALAARKLERFLEVIACDVRLQTGPGCVGFVAMLARVAWPGVGFLMDVGHVVHQRFLARQRHLANLTRHRLGTLVNQLNMASEIFGQLEGFAAHVTCYILTMLLLRMASHVSFGFKCDTAFWTGGGVFVRVSLVEVVVKVAFLGKGPLANVALKQFLHLRR